MNSNLTLDSEDVEGLLEKIETSFQIKFVGDELKNIKTYREFVDIILEKIQLTDIKNDCTSQQFFYKFRDTLKNLELKSEVPLTPSVNLKSYFFGMDVARSCND